MKFKTKSLITFLSIAVLSLSFQAKADDCADLFNEAVKVEKHCAQVVDYIKATLEYNHKLLDAMNALPYKSAHEQDVTKKLAAKTRKDDADAQGLINESCDKRWNVSSVYAGTCGDELIACEANGKGKINVVVIEKAAPVAKVKKGQKPAPVVAPRKHAMHTYDDKYACLERKNKILKHAH